MTSVIVSLAARRVAGCTAANRSGCKHSALDDIDNEYHHELVFKSEQIEFIHIKPLNTFRSTSSTFRKKFYV